MNKFEEFKESDIQVWTRRWQLLVARGLRRKPVFRGLGNGPYERHRSGQYLLVGMVANAIKDCSKQRQIVLGPFGGSGTSRPQSCEPFAMLRELTHRPTNRAQFASYNLCLTKACHTAHNQSSAKFNTRQGFVRFFS